MNLIFANSIKRSICHVKNSLLVHDLPTSVNDREISQGFIFTKLKPSRKFLNLQYARSIGADLQIF